MSGAIIKSQSVRVAILSDSHASYVKPMADGLARMVRMAGGCAEIFCEGLDALAATSPPPGADDSRGRHSRAPRGPFNALAAKLRAFDVVVVVQSIPRAFLRTFFWDEVVRSLLGDVPLVLYDVFYLPTRGLWPHWLREGFPAGGIPDGGHWGLDRYDWYLCASVVSEVGLPRVHNPVSLVGLHLDDGTLQPEQPDRVLALLDFEHPPDMHERAVQIMALEQTRTPYVVLNGRYSTAEIRRLYRQTSIYFVAMRESFGLPICEAQACGSLVFTPYANWCPSHWKKDDLSVPGEGHLSPNFIVYDNDLDRLITEIRRVRATHNPAHVRETFIRHDPQFFGGDVAAVAEFLTMVQSGVIHSQLHLQHSDVPIPSPTDLMDWPTPLPQASGRYFPSLTT